VARKNKRASGANADHGSGILIRKAGATIARIRLTHHGTKTKSSAREDFRRGMVDRDAAKFVPSLQSVFPLHSEVGV